MPLHAPKGGLISHKPALKKKKKALSFCEKQVLIERHLGLSLYCAINKRCRVCRNLLHVNGELKPSSSVVTFDSLGDPHSIKDVTSAIWEINVGKHFFLLPRIDPSCIAQWKNNQMHCEQLWIWTQQDCWEMEWNAFFFCQKSTTGICSLR